MSFPTPKELAEKTSTAEEAALEQLKKTISDSLYQNWIPGQVLRITLAKSLSPRLVNMLKVFLHGKNWHCAYHYYFDQRDGEICYLEIKEIGRFAT